MRRDPSRKARSAHPGAESTAHDLPDKLHFKIGEVARLVGVKPHVLRFWETEFGALRPQKTQTNQRVYRRREVELLLLIKRLLYQDGFTISGAKRRIAELSRETAPLPAELTVLLRHLCRELRELVALTRLDATRKER